MNTDGRKYILIVFFLATGFVFIGRLAYMQIFDTKWHQRAEEITEHKKLIFPARGIVYDRTGKKIIKNETYYDLMFKEKYIEDLDTVAFAQLLGMTPLDVRHRFAEIREKHSRGKEIYLKVLSYAFIKEITKEEMTKIAPHLYKFKGFYEQPRTMRTYPYHNGANIVGYISGVWKEDLDKDDFYHRLDYIGRTGIESSYEKTLRGVKGVKYILQTAGGSKSGTYENGMYDTAALAGKHITLSIDATLQTYGELLMKNKRGCIVAIEPSTGEILALVSAPNYDPNLLVGERNIRKNWNALVKDSLKPLFPRPLQAEYPPGSIFKILQALVGQQEGVLTETTGFPCNKALFGCHNHPSPNSLDKAVQFSCNPYFYYAMRSIVQQGKEKSIFKDAPIGLDIWAKYMQSFGLGHRPKIDIGGARGGNIPDSDYYNRWYKPGSWAFSTIKSNAIGQGEVTVTPLQMANIAAILANRGFYYEPHLIKSIENDTIHSRYLTKKKTMVDSKYFPIVIEGMRKVVNEAGGTARRARLKDIIVCGKTGTAENFAKINGKREQLTDHSVFISFAPMDNPKIAIAVYVENAGFGGTWAAPIASLMTEKYLTDSIADPKKEQRILDANLLYNR